MQKQFLEAGKFVTTHGIMGELKAYPYCDGPDFLCGFDTIYLAPDGSKPVKVTSARVQKNVTLIRLAGVDSIESARPYINKMFYIDRQTVQLPQGRYFVQDLIGCEVRDDATGEVYGTIADVSDNGASNIYEIKTPKGAVWFPAVKEFLGKTDLANGVITVKPIGGMFDDAD